VFFWGKSGTAHDGTLFELKGPVDGTHETHATPNVTNVKWLTPRSFPAPGQGNQN